MGEHTGAFQDMLEALERFASENIAPREDLGSSTEFPFDLWKRMGEEGLLGASVPEEYGGSGLGYGAISRLAMALARRGGCLGIVLSWLMHQIACRFVMAGMASKDLMDTYLPGLAAGEATVSIAISEPKTGAHPRHMETRAEKTARGYLVSGEKAFLTNGPIASLFVVVAVTKTEGGLKSFSSMVVRRETEGLEVLPPLDVGFLHPCPHGAITMDRCAVGEDHVLGRPHKAYEDLVVPFRLVEDVCLMGMLIGSARSRLDDIVSKLRDRGTAPGEEVVFSLGGLESSLRAIEVLASEAARILDADGPAAEIRPLVLAFRSLFSEIHKGTGLLYGVAGVTPSQQALTMGKDLDALGGFASRVARRTQVKIGSGMLGGVSRVDI